MFKFSTQELLRKRNHILSPYCQPHSLWFTLSVCSRTLGSEERHCGFQAVSEGWGGGRACYPGVGTFSLPGPGAALSCWGSAHSWGALRGAETPLHCLSLPLVGSTAKHKVCALKTCTLCQGLRNNLQEQIKAEDVGKASIVLVEDTWRLFIFPRLWMEKDPLRKDISAFFVAHNNLIICFAAHWEQKAFQALPVT